MAFDPQKFIQDYFTPLRGSPSPREKFDPQTFIRKNYPQLSQNPIMRVNDLGTTQSLYRTAQQIGLGKEADRILAQKGEKPKEIFSGGFITDIFDVLNALQYGVTGVLKGRGFYEGVKTRQSFSDKDALGNYGLPGIIGGIALDIAVDPLTYIAPWTVLKKVGLLPRIAQAAKWTEGTKVGQWLGRKFVYMHGADPTFKEVYERSIRNIAVAGENISEMVKKVAKLPSHIPLLKKDPTGRFIRRPLKELSEELSPKDFEAAAEAFNKLDDLGKEAVDLNLLGKRTWEEHVGEYIKNAYLEFEQRKGRGLFGFMRLGIRGIKKRVPGLTPEKMAELGQIDNPAFLLFKSMIDLTRDIENAKLFRLVNERFAVDVATEGFKQLPKTARLITTAGKRAELASEIKQINKALKPTFRQLDQTFKADKKTLSLIRGTEKTINRLASMRAEKLTEFFQTGQKINRITRETRRLGTLPEDLISIARRVKGFENLESLMKSDVGIEVERLFREGVLERRGFVSIKDFFQYVKEPFVKIPSKEIQVIAKENIKKIINLQKQFEQLSLKSKNLRGIDKRSIDDAFRFLEDRVNILTGRKRELIEELDILRYGDLAGKYVPENIFDYIQEISEPVKYGIGKQLVAGFKFFKVIMNPATHARNVMSNQVLNWWKLGMNPLDPRVWGVQKEALGEIARKSGKWMAEAKTVGYDLNTFASNEIRAILDSPEALTWGKKLGGTWSNIRNKLGDIYQGEENFAKLSAFIFNRKYKGMGIENAWRMAEAATFNYSQVTPFIRMVRESLFGFPFITFSLKATPIAIETALKAPRRISVFGKAKNAIENASDIKETEREKASQPQWIRDGFFIKLPIKDEHNRSAYFDLSYIIPFGDLVSGHYISRRINRETGLPEGLPMAFLEKTPLLGLIRELSRNQDFFGDKIWRETDSKEKQLGDMFRHITKMYVPPLVADQLPGGYIPSTMERRQRGIIGALRAPDEIRQQRTLMQELLRNIGAKIQPIDVDIQETFMEREKRRALETLLLESGQFREFRRIYTPKK